MAGYGHTPTGPAASSHPDRPLCMITPGLQTPNYMVDIRLLLTWNALAVMVGNPFFEFSAAFPQSNSSNFTTRCEEAPSSSVIHHPLLALLESKATKASTLLHRASTACRLSYRTCSS